MHFTGLPFALEPERVIQTHANLVLLKGELAYKLKKPVKFPFLDYSTLELRRQMILNELTFNRRFSREIYLGVAEVRKNRNQLEIGGLEQKLSDTSDPDVVDYCVIMKRIPDDAWLPAMLAAGKVNEHQIIALMQRLVAALQATPTTDEVRANGRPDSLRHNTVANIAECEQFVGQCLSRERWQRLDGLLRGWFFSNHAMFNARVDQDRIRDGHGDLKPGNIAFMDGEPVITDCIEFNPLFRRLDTLAEAAFLATGLESLGAFDWAAHVFSAYREIAADQYPEDLRRYYQAHLACVMAKVTALQLLEPEVPQAQKDRAREQAAAHFELADFHAREPHVVVVMGIMGCGKSTVADAIGRHFGWPVVNSDVIRKQLAGVAPNERLPESAYSREMTDRVYAQMYAAAKPPGVVLDGQFPTADFRRPVKDALFVHCDAPDDVVRKRMEKRVLDPSRVSDATADMLADARKRFQQPRPDEALNLIKFDTRGDKAGAVKLVQQVLLSGDCPGSSGLSP
jgi:aminoglycoside phosphotransferase family enzyme/predicted kinase